MLTAMVAYLATALVCSVAMLVICHYAPIIDDCQCEAGESCYVCDPDDLDAYPYYPPGHDRPEDLIA